MCEHEKAGFAFVASWCGLLDVIIYASIDWENPEMELVILFFACTCIVIAGILPLFMTNEEKD